MKRRKQSSLSAVQEGSVVSLAAVLKRAPGKAPQPRNGSRDGDQRVANTGSNGIGGKEKVAKRDVFAELSEGFDALRRGRDA